MDANRKKQLRDEYKKKPVVGAIYVLACNSNQRRVIKSTTDIEGLKNRFQFAMDTKTCPDPAVHGDWLQYGSGAFSLEVLEELKMKEGQTAGEFATDIKLLHEMWLEKRAPETLE